LLHGTTSFCTGKDKLPAARRLTCVAVLTLLIAFSLPNVSRAAQITLQWDPVEADNIAGYRVFTRVADSAYDYSAPAYEDSANSCTIEVPLESSSCCFVVRAYDAANEESGDSNEVCAERLAMAETESQTTSTENSSQESTAETAVTPVPEEPPAATDEAAEPPSTPEAVPTEDDPSQISLTPDLQTTEFVGATEDDSHRGTRWLIYRSLDDLCVFNLYTETYLTSLPLPPLILDGETAYYWTAQYYAQNGAMSPPAKNSDVATTAWLEDLNVNGLHDGFEIVTSTDLDRDGQADESQTGMSRIGGIYDNQTYGVKFVQSGSAVTLQAAQPFDPAMMETPPSGMEVSLPAGLLNLKISVPQTGATVTLSVYLASPVPENMYWINYHPGLGYNDYTYNSSIAADRSVITIEVTDGGQGDMDGTANGFIVTLGGYGRTITTSTSAALSSDDTASAAEPKTAACFIQSIAAP